MQLNKVRISSEIARAVMEEAKNFDELIKVEGKVEMYTDEGQKTFDKIYDIVFNTLRKYENRN